MNILFITATRIGDAVISTGLLNHLIEQNPGARITIACGPLAESLFTAVPGLDRVITLTKTKFKGHWFGLWREVRQQHWDVVVDLRRSLIPYLVRTKQRYRLGPDDRKSQRVELLSGMFGIDPPSPPKIFVSDEQERQAEAILPKDVPVIALCPTAARPDKMWPVDQYAALAGILTRDQQRFADVKLLLLGAEQDRPILEHLNSSLPEGCGIILAGYPNLQCVSAALSRCTATVANDSGLAHLAAASGSPTVALFGPTRADLYRPWGMRVAVVQAPEKHGGRRISDVLVDDVVAGIHSVLD